MKTCYKCGATVSDTAKFCRKCGADLTAQIPEEPVIETGSDNMTVILNEEQDDYHDAGYRYENEYRNENEYEYRRPHYEEPEFSRAAGYAAGGAAAGAAGAGAAKRAAAPADLSWDHTAEFDPQDVSDNKVLAMLVYLMGPLGIIISMIGSNHSPYARFHIRQGLKIQILAALSYLAVGLLCLLILVPSMIGLMNDLQYGMSMGGSLAGASFAVILFVAELILLLILKIIQIISFFSVCKGNAIEPPIIRSCRFMK